MLVEFSVGNFRSIKEQISFSMVATGLVAKDKAVDASNVFEISNDLRLLRSAAIYGANASGKSNLVKAMRFMRNMILNSSKESQAADPIPVERFRLSADMIDEPSYFECVFLLNGEQFRYGFEVSVARVMSEWLFHRPGTKEARLFMREDGEIRLSREFKEGKGLESKTRDNALFLSVASQFNGELSTRILRWFRTFSVVSGLSDWMYRRFTVENFLNNKYRLEIIDFLKKLDIGIHDIIIDSGVERVSLSDLTPDDRSKLPRIGRAGLESTQSIRTIHRRLDPEMGEVLEAFDMDQHESEGTRKLFALSGPLIDTLAHGRVLIIDEFDARVHPLISKAIVALFNSPESNPRNAQLVFTTHDTNLLSNKIFRRDQIWFTEKDQWGATKLFSLAEYKVRNDASYEADYIRGRYGAIPFIGDIRRVLEEEVMETSDA